MLTAYHTSIVFFQVFWLLTLWQALHLPAICNIVFYRENRKIIHSLLQLISSLCNIATGLCLQTQEFIHSICQSYKDGKHVVCLKLRYATLLSIFVTRENLHRRKLWLDVVCVCSVALLCLSDSLWPHGLQPTRLLCPWDFPGRNTGVHCHFLLQGIFPTQGSNCATNNQTLSYRFMMTGGIFPQTSFWFLYILNVVSLTLPTYFRY